MDIEPENALETILCDELAQGDAVLADLAPVLIHMVGASDASLFNDQIIATVRGMGRHIGEQFLMAQAEASGEISPELFAEAGGEGLAFELLRAPEILLYCHALAYEAQMIARLQETNAIDSVSSPMVQAMIASGDDVQSTAAMRYLAAEVRFVQNCKRMELPLSELPSEIFAHAVRVWREFVGEGAEVQIGTAEIALSRQHDAGATRISVIERALTALAGEAKQALSLTHSGFSFFVSALASFTNQARSSVILATNEQQMGRLALCMRAAGMETKAVEAEFAVLHPDIAFIEGFDSLEVDRAHALLAASPHGAEE